MAQTQAVGSTRIRLREILTIIGALCSLLIGSGFATGQEALQYFASYGWWGLAGVAVLFVIFTWLLIEFLEWGRQNPEKIKNVFVHYCGPIIGNVLKYFVPFFLFSVVVTMMSGAGALLYEAYGIPVYGGTLIIAAMIAITLLLGLNRLVGIVGVVGPFVIVFLLVVGVAVVATHAGQLAEATSAIAEFHPPQAGGNWFLAAVLYAASTMLACVPFLASLGTTSRNNRMSFAGGLFGSFAFSIVLLIMTLALLATMAVAHDKATPLVVLASGLFLPLGFVFAIVTFLGVYSTAAPLIWSVANQLTPASGRYYKTISIALTVVALIGGATLPFGTLVGTIFPIAGYFGLFLMASVIYRQLTARLKEKSSQNESLRTEKSPASIQEAP
ncbi:hypothetical protein [Arthrobacter sp. MYb213]|uniref:YkvI family membrane protein n=1 Tax=Arthrobacter sp. MYb213 TaxID=1848595 RepID=UPI000CFC98FD|nr:hypothetical protein [Arthrobacter sp. MYb213]PRB66770.1 hypothetical protein CQ011_17120 [Arthrobacter sp. MYb213]